MNIKEIARILHITPRAIRFYEEKGLIAPDKNERNGYREFQQADVWRLQTIVALREIGVPLGDIRNWLGQAQDGGESIRRFLELQRSALFSQWIELQQAIGTVDKLLGGIERGEAPAPERLFELAERTRARKDVRRSWRDSWNYDETSAHYDERIAHPGYDAVLRHIVEAVGVSVGETGLDIGAGTGNLAGLLIRDGVRIVAVDQSAGMLGQCRRKHPKVETRIGNFLAIPAFDRSFDFVVSSFALCHLTDEQKPLAVQELRRVLKPHGRLCLADCMINGDSTSCTVDDWRAHRYPARLTELVNWLEQAGFLVSAAPLADEVQLIRAVLLKNNA